MKAINIFRGHESYYHLGALGKGHMGIPCTIFASLKLFQNEKLKKNKISFKSPFPLCPDNRFVSMLGVLLLTSFLPSQAYGKSRVSGKRKLWVLVVASAHLALEAWASHWSHKSGSSFIKRQYQNIPRQERLCED